MTFFNNLKDDREFSISLIASLFTVFLIYFFEIVLDSLNSVFKLEIPIILYKLLVLMILGLAIIISIKDYFKKRKAEAFLSKIKRL